MGNVSNGALVVTTQTRDTNIIGDGSVSSISFAGTNLTRIGDIDNSVDGVRADIFYLLSPPAGLGTITVNLIGVTVLESGGAISLSGVNQSTPTDGNAGGTASAIGGGTVSITTTVDNDWIIDSIYQKSGNTSALGASQTLIFELFPGSSPVNTGNGSGDTTDSSYKITTTHGVYKMSYTWSPSDDMAYCAAAFQPAPEAKINVVFKTLLGVGQT